MIGFGFTSLELNVVGWMATVFAEHRFAVHGTIVLLKGGVPYSIHFALRRSDSQVKACNTPVPNNALHGTIL